MFVFNFQKQNKTKQNKKPTIIILPQQSLREFTNLYQIVMFVAGLELFD